MSGGVVEEVVSVVETGKRGGGADFEALCSIFLGFCLQGFANILPTQFQACSNQTSQLQTQH